MATATKEKRKPGRPKETQAAERIGPDFVTETPKDMRDAEEAWRSEQVETERNLAIVDKQYGDDLPYDRTRLESEARFYMQESAAAMLEAGRRLIVLKEHEGHGQFTSSLERIGISSRAAQKMMQVAVKFSNAPTLAHLGKSKMLELMVEDDDDLEALADGGTVAGLKLDDIEKMSVRELKAELRKERERRKEEAEANERLLEKKDQKLNQLEKTLDDRQRRVKTWDGVVSEININLTNMTGGAIMHMQHLREQIEQINAECIRLDLSKPEMEAIVKPFADHIATLGDYLRELEQDFGLNLSVYMPDFTTDQIQSLED